MAYSSWEMTSCGEKLGMILWYLKPQVRLSRKIKMPDLNRLLWAHNVFPDNGFVFVFHYERDLFLFMSSAGIETATAFYDAHKDTEVWTLIPYKHRNPLGVFQMFLQVFGVLDCSIDKGVLVQ